MSANGSNGIGAAGGGAGGSVLVQAGRVVGTGRIEALGGNGAAEDNAGGAGGGGRIAIHTWDRVFLATDATLAEPGAPAGAGAGSVHRGRTTDDALWFGIDVPVLHGSVALGWAALAVPPFGTVSRLSFEHQGIETVLSTGPGSSGNVVWYTPSVADGPYRLRLVVQEANGRVRLESERTISILNRAAWHSGIVVGPQTWSSDSLHVVDTELVVRAGASITVEPGAVVKCVRGARLVLEPGAVFDARGLPELPVVLTGISDDSVGIDVDGDVRQAPPRPGDWSLVWPEGATFSRNDSTVVRYARFRRSGSVSGEARFDGMLVHEISSDLVLQPGSHLVVESGAIVKFHPNAGLVVSAGARLEARGTLAAPIFFTSVRDDAQGGDTNGDANRSVPEPGVWRWIRVEGKLDLEHARLRYGGGSPSGSWNGTGMLRVEAGGSMTLRRCRVENALFDGILSFGSVAAESCILRANDRGLAVHGGTARAVHATFLDNRQAVQIHGGGLDLLNSIVAHSQDTGVLQDLPSPSPVLRACLFWNPAPTARNTAGFSDPIGISGNLAADPRFADPDSGDEHLAFGSPAIDAADGRVAPPLDARQAPRFDDPRSPNTGKPTATGTFADIGALEFVENASSDTDLVALGVVGPAVATAGETAIVRWTVLNAGSETVRTPWRDAIRLVPVDVGNDVETAPAAIEVALVPRTSPLAPGATLEGEAVVIVPPGTPGLWRWSIRANARGDVFEGRQTLDNVAVASALTELPVPTLAVGTPANFAFAAPGLPAGFGFEVSPGRPFRLQLDADSTDGRFRIYAAAGRMPTESDFDLVSSDGDGTDARLGGLPSELSTRWYVLAVPEDVPDGRLGAVLTLSDAVFELREVEIVRAGNRGSVTVPVVGDAFDATLRLRLRAPDGRTLPAVETEVVDASHARARFELADVPLGFYDAIAEQNGVVRELPDVLEIVPPTVSRLSVRWQLPERAREHRPFDLYLVYGNPGETDLPIPRLSVGCVDGSGEIWLPGEDESRFRETAITFVRLATVADEAGETNKTDRVSPASVRRLASSGTRADDGALTVGPRVLPPGTTQRLHLRAASALGASAVAFEAKVGDDSEADPL
ncbi:MAG: hypothetical protein JNL97_14200, partial [Verrucomicrobiales bacterium]|nr:hypothetical protein [Verrucomicrobiales bacterium]